MADISLARRKPATVQTASPALSRIARRGALYAVLCAGAIGAAFPFVWMVLTAVKPRAEAVRNPPTVLPETWRWENFVDAWQAAPFGRYFFNSFLVSTVVAIGVMATSLLAAYAFTRLRFPGRDLLFGLFLATMMIPFESTLIPNFMTVRTLGIYDSYAGLIVPWLANVVGIFLMRQFFITLPNELFEAATIDGCGHFRMLWNVVLPLARGPLGAVALFNFLAQWNGLLWPLIVIGSHQEYFPVQLGLSTFVNADANEPQLQMAAAAFTIAPILVFYFFLQRQFIEGIASTGLKG
ncbi:MAG: carbohydrate ABC transporter permease [Chloroflexi bacterium]|nr:carbohydrate ABC transporter permease [Chloroflexota bacterium]